MAMTNAEKQKAFKERKDQAITDLTEAVKQLTTENTTLREKLEAATKKIHAMELKIAKAGIK